MQAIDCEDALQAKYGKKATGKQCSVALIGPSGENLSLIAGVCNERGRLAARSGVGAVMGSKKLKAIVVNSTRKIIHQDKDTLQMVSADLKDFVKPTADFSAPSAPPASPMSALSGDSVKNQRRHVADLPEVQAAGTVVTEHGQALRLLALPSLRRRVQGTDRVR
jgi:aldehyde:ferredoxin oxidoreductase